MSVQGVIALVSNVLRELLPNTSSAGSGDAGKLVALNTDGVIDPSMLIRKQTIIQTTSTMAIDYSAGQWASISMQANADFTVTNWPVSGIVGRLVLKINNTGSFNITSFPPNTTWPGGIVPSLTQGSGKEDTFIFTTSNAGTEVQGQVIGQDYH